MFTAMSCVGVTGWAWDSSESEVVVSPRKAMRSPWVWSASSRSSGAKVVLPQTASPPWIDSI